MVFCYRKNSSYTDQIPVAGVASSDSSSGFTVDFPSEIRRAETTESLARRFRSSNPAIRRGDRVSRPSRPAACLPPVGSRFGQPASQPARRASAAATKLHHGSKKACNACMPCIDHFPFDARVQREERSRPGRKETNNTKSSKSCRQIQQWQADHSATALMRHPIRVRFASLSRTESRRSSERGGTLVVKLKKGACAISSSSIEGAAAAGRSEALQCGDPQSGEILLHSYKISSCPQW